jgi:hypothetical protein
MSNFVEIGAEHGPSSASAAAAVRYRKPGNMTWLECHQKMHASKPEQLKDNLLFVSKEQVKFVLTSLGVQIIQANLHAVHYARLQA